MLSLEVRNESINGKQLIQIKEFLGRPFVCSRIRHEGHVSIPYQDTRFYIGDQVFIVCSEEDAEAVTAFIGKEVQNGLGKTRHADDFTTHIGNQA